MTPWSEQTLTGGPSAMMCPCAMQTTQSLIPVTTSISCSTNRTVMPSSRRPVMCPSSDWVSAGFTPAVGSSSMSMAGSTISARASSSSLRCPPDSVPANWSRTACNRNRSISSSARRSISSSCALHSGRAMEAKNRSPVCCLAASFRFSSTVSSVSDFVSWKVRTIPARATRYAGIPASGWPSNRQLPPSGFSNPVSRLNSVVLPAPLGPMSAVIAPRWTSSLPISTARSPPKALTMPSATSMASGLAAPGCGAASASSDSVGCGSSLTDKHLPTIAKHALWTVDHQEHKHEPDKREPDCADLCRDDDGGRDEASVDGLTQEAVREHQNEPENDRADDGAKDTACPAQDQQRVKVERHYRVECVWLHGLGVDGKQHSPDRAKRAAEHEALHLVAVDVLAHATDGILVLTDRTDDPSPGAVDDQAHDPAGERRERPADDHDPQLLVAEAQPADPVLALRDRADRVKGVGELSQAVHTAGDRGGEVGPVDVAEYLTRRDRRDRQIVGAQPEGGYSEQQREHDRRGKTGDHADK